jgi:uncharacterized membrane protein
MYVEKWDIGTVLAVSWERFKAHAAGVLVSMIAAGAIMFVVQMIGNVIQQLPPLLTEAGIDETIVIVLTILVQLFFGVINWLVNTWFGMGLIKVYLKAARDEEPGVGDLFSVGPVYLSALLAGLVVGVAYLGGFVIGAILLWVPLVIMMLGFMMYKYAIIDQDLGPIECIKESWRLTDGEKGQLFLWGIVTFFVNLAGFLVCIVGLFITVPVTAIGTSYIYDNQLRRKGRADGSEVGGSGGGQGGSDYSFDAADKPAPASRATTDGDAPLMGKP